MYHSVVRRVYVALDVLVGAPEPGGSGDGGFGRRAGGGVKAETFLQWHLLPQSDFFFFSILVAKRGFISDLSSVDIVSISLHQDLDQSLC